LPLLFNKEIKSSSQIFETAPFCWSAYVAMDINWKINVIKKKLVLFFEEIYANSGKLQKSQPIAPGENIAIVIKLAVKNEIRTSTVVLPVRHNQSKRPT
jgi:hypothetical protein